MKLALAARGSQETGFTQPPLLGKRCAVIILTGISAEEVLVFLALDIPQVDALAATQHNWNLSSRTFLQMGTNPRRDANKYCLPKLVEKVCFNFTFRVVAPGPVHGLLANDRVGGGGSAHDVHRGGRHATVAGSQHVEY